MQLLGQGVVCNNVLWGNSKMTAAEASISQLEIADRNQPQVQL